jgi:hypothetical protein
MYNVHLQLSHEDNAKPKENAALNIQNEQNLKQVPQYKFSFDILLC